MKRVKPREQSLFKKNFPERHFSQQRSFYKETNFIFLFAQIIFIAQNYLVGTSSTMYEDKQLVKHTFFSPL